MWMFLRISPVEVGRRKTRVELIHSDPLTTRAVYLVVLSASLCFSLMLLVTNVVSVTVVAIAVVDVLIGGVLVNGGIVDGTSDDAGASSRQIYTVGATRAPRVPQASCSQSCLQRPDRGCYGVLSCLVLLAGTRDPKAPEPAKQKWYCRSQCHVGPRMSLCVSRRRCVIESGCSGEPWDRGIAS